MVILEVNTNCGCTVANFPEAPIAPGKQGVISIVFDPKGNPGEFAKEIVVKTNIMKIFPVFSSLSFIISGLIFKSLIHFELIFVNGIR